MSESRLDINQAKRALGRELRSKDGFVGIGIANDLIRIYAKSEAAPVVEFLQSQYGTTYQGYSVAVIPSNGFRVHSRA